MFNLKDRYDRAYALGPTHEEFFCFSKYDGYKVI